MRILYLQHVDDSWLPQRPHFFSRELARMGHDLMVLYLRAWRRSGLIATAESQGSCRSSGIWGIPRWASTTLTARADALLIQVETKLQTKGFAPEVVWATHPRLATAARQFAATAKIVYDCMDDAPALEPRGASTVACLERQLLADSSTVLASSPHLAQRIHTLSPDTPVHLIRNGIVADYPWPGLGERTLPSARDRLRVLFFGTIGPWLDFALLAFLAKQPSVDLLLVGPVRTAMPQDLAAHVHPAMPHRALLDFAQAWADWLLLPFKIDEFAETVDPVKAYEYVALAKPIAAPSFDVLGPLRPFLSIYRDEEDLLRNLTDEVQIRSMLSAPNRPEFIRANTWTARAEQLARVLESLR